MRQEAVFAPMSVLALWTACMMFMVGFSRIRAVRAGRVRRGAFRMGESPEVPADVTVWNRNLMNLLEMPLLFYVVSIAFYVTHQVTPEGGDAGLDLSGAPPGAFAGARHVEPNSPAALVLCRQPTSSC